MGGDERPEDDVELGKRPKNGDGIGESGLSGEWASQERVCRECERPPKCEARQLGESE